MNLKLARMDPEIEITVLFYNLRVGSNYFSLKFSLKKRKVIFGQGGTCHVWFQCIDVKIDVIGLIRLG